ncbi:DUF58 domain-containing protein [Shumkonia mesophila]|uniref:DUF58 domain-containing protein n=1 Tax=Shumkonia mesophila TaxID=2838854 RepID=UPI0029341264|nr:DUF58 domain-containing protein [Shumkonia mesophila]
MAEARTRLHHRAEALAATLPPLLVAAERVAATVSQGVHGRRRIGQGETFWQFRRYQAGDSAGRIDWRQSAKSQPVYIRENEWEAAQSVWLWRDGSPSMAYRSSEAVPLKSARADLLTLALASLLVRGGEHIALIGTGVAPAAGRAALLRIADTIEFGRTAGTSLPAAEPLPRYARIVMVGDFLVPLARLRETLAAFSARGVKGHLLQILDPAEETFPFAGRIQFEGPEDEGRLLIGRAESVRDDYREAMAAHQRGLEALARQTGWSLATHRTDRPAETPLLALFLALSQGVDA